MEGQRGEYQRGIPSNVPGYLGLMSLVGTMVFMVFIHLSAWSKCTMQWKSGAAALAAYALWLSLWCLIGLLLYHFVLWNKVVLFIGVYVHFSNVWLGQCSEITVIHFCVFWREMTDVTTRRASHLCMKESLVDNEGHPPTPHPEKKKNISKKCWAQQEVVCLEQTQRLCSFFLSSLCVILGCSEFGLYIYMFFFLPLRVISHFCVPKDFDVNKYFYGKMPHLLNALLAWNYK